MSLPTPPGLEIARADGTERQHMKQAEAFCLMKYRRERDGAIEWIWNSRNGVTPFCIDVFGEDEAKHADWGEDAPAPNFVPPIGMRVFVGDPGAPRLVTVDETLHDEFEELARTRPWRKA